MKKNILKVCCVLAMLVVPASGFAAVDTINTASATINNNGTTPKGPATVPFDPSPNVTISLYSTIAGYAMSSANTLTDGDNGLEYATHSEATGYAQRAKTTDKGVGPEAVTAVGSAGIPGEGWEWMGGGAGS